MNNKIQVIENNKLLLYSNRICCFSNDTISLKYEFDEKSVLTMVFHFHYNENNGQDLKIKSEGNDKIIIDSYNFKNPLGTGLKEPMKIAKYKEQDLYIVFFIYKMNECNPIIDLSLYMENCSYER